MKFSDPSGHVPCLEIDLKGRCITLDYLKLPNVPPPIIPEAPSGGDSATPWDVGVEWLTGEGPRYHEFREGDPFTELLQDHSFLEYIREKIAEMLRNGDLRGVKTRYDLSGIEGVPKYMKDYSTVVTLGVTGNIAVTFLGSYKVDVYIYRCQLFNWRGRCTFPRF